MSRPDRYPYLDARTPGEHREYRLEMRYEAHGRLTERQTGRRYNVYRIYADTETTDAQPGKAPR